VKNVIGGKERKEKNITSYERKWQGKIATKALNFHQMLITGQGNRFEGKKKRCNANLRRAKRNSQRKKSNGNWG